MKKISEFIEKIGFLIKDIAEAFRSSLSGWSEIDIDKVNGQSGRIKVDEVQKQ